MPHGMGDRPSGDVDLNTGRQHRGEFPELTAAVVVAALEAAGYKVSVIMSAETFIRLSLASPEGAEEKVELAVDWRAHDPRSACR
jgi:hypothetical protein